MNRRAFLSTIAAGLAAAADPERLLWVPGKKLISIPSPLDYSWSVPPFHIMATMPMGQKCADVFNRLIAHRWRTDRAFRDSFSYEAAHRVATGVMGDLLKHPVGSTALRASGQARMEFHLRRPNASIYEVDEAAKGVMINGVRHTRLPLFILGGGTKGVMINGFRSTIYRPKIKFL